jgi:hypothetical protein
MSTLVWSSMWFHAKLAFAGIGFFLLHWSLGALIILACLVIEFAAGWLVSYLPFLRPVISLLQKYALLVAIGTALILLGEWLGAKDMADRCDAQAAVVTSTVHKAVVKAKHPRPSNGSRAKWDTDK